MSATERAARQLIDDGDMRIQIVKREINQGALAGLGSEVGDQAAALILAALDSFDRHLSARDRRDLEQARMGRCLLHDHALGYSHPECGFCWHGKNAYDVPTRDGEPICPRCALAMEDR